MHHNKCIEVKVAAIDAAAANGQKGIGLRLSGRLFVNRKFEQLLRF